MDAALIVAVVTAVGTQLVAVIKALKSQRDLVSAIGPQNGLGTVQDALHTINSKLDAQSGAIADLGQRVTALETR
jgi:hypothetical protein